MKIVIIGGGITGLSTALALNKSGIACTVFEKAPQLNEVGAGIWMQPNAMKILDWMGIGNKVRNAGKQMDMVQITNKKLIPIKKPKHKYLIDEWGTKIISVHRARLQKILFDSLPDGTVQPGKEYKNHKTKDGKVKIEFQASDPEIEADIMFGADGINSNVRKNIFPFSSQRYSGQTCWRGIANIELPQKYATTGIEAWGNKIRFGFSSISGKEVYWFAVAKSGQNLKDDLNSVREKLLITFRSFNPLISRIIQHTPMDKIIRNDIGDLNRLKNWSADRICLIGDAAHATTPNMGQGACQGVEDAYYMSKLLSKISDYKEVFARFEQARRKKVDYVVNTSWQLGKMVHHPVGQAILRFTVKLTPEKILINQTRKLYFVENL